VLRKTSLRYPTDVCSPVRKKKKKMKRIELTIQKKSIFRDFNLLSSFNSCCSFLCHTSTNNLSFSIHIIHDCSKHAAVVCFTEILGTAVPPAPRKRGQGDTTQSSLFSPAQQSSAGRRGKDTVPKKGQIEILPLLVLTP